MTYPEREHPHQSEMMKCLPEDYTPLAVSDEGERIYGVIKIEENGVVIDYRSEEPAFGGYINREMIYGSVKYCRNATRHHRKHFEMYGAMPHLIFFDSAMVAEELGFRRCKQCK